MAIEVNEDGSLSGPGTQPCGPGRFCSLLRQNPIDSEDPIDQGGNPIRTLPVAKKPEDPTPPPADTTGQTNTNSTSPEFNTLAQMVNSQMAAGAPITPYLQNQGQPTVVPTQSTGSRLSAPVIALFAIAGAAGYYYYRKHGGPGIHEAL